jgi:hypothetical protein
MQNLRLLVLLLQLCHLLHSPSPDLDIFLMTIPTPNPILFGDLLTDQTLSLELLLPHAFLKASHMKIMLTVRLNHCSILIAYITFMILIFRLPPDRHQLRRRQRLLFLAATQILHCEKQNNQ